MTGAGENDTDPDATAATRVDGPRSKKDSHKLERGDSLGRYIVLGPLGEGGMGLVYRAYDPELERRIAIKLVRFRRGQRAGRARERLLREAQALAQLSHPNVVAVHDVGSLGDDLFIAMELVDGVTLRDWLKARPRELSEILTVFVAAGRGLEAAHSAGLVHRDFKPDNIIIGVDGRARVIDFGLARAAYASLDASGSGDDAISGEAELTGGDSSTAGDDPSSGSGRGLSARLTRVGSVVGTPAYMAPEQHRGEKVDAKSDQFSFCVTLWRAVYKVHPFMDPDADSEAAFDVDDVARRIREGDREPRDGGSVPGWLSTVLARGLSNKASDRYESMTPILTELARDFAGTRRRAAVAVGVGAIACAAVFGLFSGGSSDVEPCRGGPERFATAWNADRRSNVIAKFTELRGQPGKQAGELVASAVGEFGHRWEAMYTEACRATQVLGEQSEELLDKRMACLDRKLGKVGALADAFVKAPSAKAIDRSVVAAATMPDLSACADEKALMALTPPPESAETREKIKRIRARVDRLEALLLSGSFTDAAPLAAELSMDSKSIGYPPLAAEALYLNAVSLRRLRKGSDAERLLHRAALSAAEARDDDRLAQIWIELLWVVGYTQKRIDDGLALRPIAEAAVARAGNSRRGDLLNNVGALLRKKGDFDAAREALEEALELWKEHYGVDHVQVSKAHNNLGNALTDMGRYREGRDHHERVIEIREKELGGNHPATASSYNNLGNAHLELGEYAQARDAYERALEIYESLDPNAGDVTMALNNLGSALAELGETRRARKLQRRAIEIQKKTLAPDDAELGISMNNLADLELKTGDFESALSYYKKAQGIWARGLGAEHTYVGHARTGVGFALLGLERWPEAIAEFDGALALWKTAHGDGHPPSSAALLGVGLARIGLAQPKQAIAPLRRAAELRKNGAPTGLADVQFALAKAIAAAGGKQTDAAALADKARAVFSASPATADRVRDIDAWRRQVLPTSSGTISP